MTATTRRPPGGAPVDIPEVLLGLLEASYRSGKPIHLTVPDPGAPDVKELLRLGRIHARRTGKSFRTYTSPAAEGQVRLEMIIRDKQIYTRKATTSE